jgi:pimeloyl-ACP methyl ester carboxylesterase
VGDGPGGHCVVLDVDALPAFAGDDDPVGSCLAWIHRETGVRGGPHLDAGHRIRFAVPVGMPAERARQTAARLTALWEHRDGSAEVLGDRVTRARVTLKGEVVETFEAGDGPPLLLLHPFNIGAGVFANQFAALADRHRLVCVHHPGVGATTWAEDLTLDGIARLLSAVLERLGIGVPLHVAGASFGGLVAQAFALRYPERTASLTLIGSSYKVGNRHGPLDRLSAVVREDLDHMIEHAGSPRLREERDRLEALLLRCESMSPQIGLRYLDVFATEPDLLARLPQIATPTLIVQGSEDTIIPRTTAQLLHGAIPHAEYAEIAGAGHFPYLTHADELHRLLREVMS